MISKKKAAKVVTHQSGQPAELTSTHINKCSTFSPQCQPLIPLHGKVEGKTWCKKASMSRHMLFKPLAWAVDLNDLERAEALGVRFVEVFELEHKLTYKVSVTTLRAKGQTIDRGFGVQLALPLDSWSTFHETRGERTSIAKPGGPHE